MTDIISRIERGEIEIRVKGLEYTVSTTEVKTELMRLAKLGQQCEIALKLKNFIELMKRVDKPGKTLSLKDLAALVALAEYGQSVTWIPVTPETMPDKKQRVLTYSAEMKGSDAAIQISKGFMCYSGGTDITHWMPLPESPKERESNG